MEILDFLKQRDFPICTFLQELDKKQLFFLQFLLTCDDEADVTLACQSVDDIEYFNQRAKKFGGSKIKKITKEHLVDEITKEFEELGLNKLVYRTVYEYRRQADEIFPIPQLIAIDRLVHAIFLKEMKQFQDKVLSNPTNFQMVQEEFKNKFDYTNKPVLNCLGLLDLLGMLDKFLEDSWSASALFTEEFRERMVELLMENFLYIKECEIQQRKNEVTKQKGITLKLQEEIKKKDGMMEKQKELVKKMSAENKALKKENKQGGATEISALQERLGKLQQEIKAKDLHLMQVTAQQQQETKEAQATFEKTVSGLKGQITQLTNQLQEKTAEANRWKTIVEKMQTINMEEKLIEFIREYGLSDDLVTKIEPYYESYKLQQAQMENQEAQNLMMQEDKERIGYCIVENNVYYAVFADKSRVKITGIPEATYVGEKQFVRVTKDGSFKWVYGFRFEESNWDFDIVGFGTVTFKENEPYVVTENQAEMKLNVTSPYIQLRENQVVSFNARYQLIRFYQGVRHNADFYMASFKAKGHTAYFVLKVLSNGVLLRNIESGEDEIKLLDMSETAIAEHRTIILKENELMSAFGSPKFYTFSSYYQNGQFGYVEKRNDIWFVRKMSGEVAIMNDVPMDLDIQEGQIVKVDEFNNFLFVKREEGEAPTEMEKRKAVKKPVTVVPKSTKEKIEIRKEVLILGKPTYENSYKMALLKNGYRAEVIDGYSPWTKVKSAIKGKDVVVIAGEYCAHQNMWSIKEEVTDIPVVYAKEDGANRIVEEIMNVEQQEELMKDMLKNLNPYDKYAK